MPKKCWTSIAITKTSLRADITPHKYHISKKVLFWVNKNENRVNLRNTEEVQKHMLDTPVLTAMAPVGR